MERVRAVAHRWLSVLWLGVLTSALFASVQLQGWGCGFYRGADGYWPVALVLFAIAASWRFSTTPFSWFGVRKGLFYPPEWVGSAVAAIILYSAAILSRSGREVLCLDPLERPPFGWPLVGAIVGAAALPLLAGAGISRLRRRKTHTGEKAPTRRPLPSLKRSSFEELEQWVQDDRPITSVKQDIFGSRSIAERIVGLARRGALRRSSLALVGPKGTGKTSLLHLVQECLREAGDEVSIVEVSLWPYSTPETAIEGVLDALVRELRSFVDVTGIAALPSEYVDVIEAAGGSWAKLLSRRSSPGDVIEAIDRAAIAAGIQILLWVDDIERFARVGEDSNGVERIEPVRSLLDLLAKTRSIQPVLSVGTLQSQFDWERGSDLVEHMPGISLAEARAVVSTFREGLRNVALVATVPIASFLGEDLLKPSEDETTAALMAGIGYQSPLDSLASLFSTPRTLKHALRSAKEMWLNLLGEVNLDELIVVVALRTTHPEVFGFVNRRIADLRAPPSRRPSTSEWPFAEEFARATELQSPVVKAAILSLLQAIFPGVPDSRATPRPQSIAWTNGGRDYWQRIVRQELRDAAVLDSSLVQAVNSAAAGDLGPITEHLTSDRDTIDIESFAERALTAERLLQLLRHNYQLLRKRTEKELLRDPHAVVAIWRMLLKNRPKPVDLLRTLIPLLEDSTGTDLPLAHSILHLFGTPDPTVDLLQAEERRELWHAFRDALRAQFLTKHMPLEHALKGGNRFLLSWCIWTLERIRKNEFDRLPFEWWPEFADVLVDAAARAPEIIIPQVVGLIIKPEHRIDSGEDGRMEARTEYVLDPMRARLLLTTQQLSKVASAVVKIPELGSEAAILRAAVKHAPARIDLRRRGRASDDEDFSGQRCPMVLVSRLGPRNKKPNHPHTSLARIRTTARGTVLKSLSLGAALPPEGDARCARGSPPQSTSPTRPTGWVRSIAVAPTSAASAPLGLRAEQVEERSSPWSAVVGTEPSTQRVSE